MREIKFRALTKNNNVMAFGDLIICPNGDRRIIWFEEKEDVPLEIDCISYNEVIQDSTIGQYIGLKDKNGKDAYCGDIYIDCDDKKWVICQDNLITWAELLPHRIDYSRDFDPEIWEKDCKIIGNIYENPELLNQ